MTIKNIGCVIAYRKGHTNYGTSLVVLLRKLGFTVSIYDSDYEGKANIRLTLRYLIIRTKQFVGNHRILWFLLPKIR